MNLILSDDTDATTAAVQCWLKYFGCPVLRINGNDAFTISSIHLGSPAAQNTVINLTVRNGDWKMDIPLHEINKYWYRRGSFSLAHATIKENAHVAADTTFKLNKAVSIEYNEVIKFLNFYLSTKSCISSFNDNYINKLNVLLQAEMLGLSVPPTLVATRKTELADFAHTHQSIISKAIWNGDVFVIDKGMYNLGNTALFDYEKLEPEIPDEFPMSLFQAYVPKKYELRIFYLHERLYASCIFSQRDPRTRVDFREYNRENPNRVVPYNVPEPIGKKIIQLMRSLDMNSGSLDMIYGEDGHYYFLEVNPVGQFAQVSYPCNYYLEREIASFFTHKI